MTILWGRGSVGKSCIQGTLRVWERRCKTFYYSSTVVCSYGELVSCPHDWVDVDDDGQRIFKDMRWRECGGFNS